VGEKKAGGVFGFWERPRGKSLHGKNPAEERRNSTSTGELYAREGGSEIKGGGGKKLMRSCRRGKRGNQRPEKGLRSRGKHALNCRTRRDHRAKECQDKSTRGKEGMLKRFGKEKVCPRKKKAGGGKRNEATDDDIVKHRPSVLQTFTGEN